MNKKKGFLIALFLLIVKGLTETSEPEEDACPNVMAKPGTSLKLFYDIINGEDRVCCGCNPGTYMKQPCRSTDEATTTVCKPCPTGTYMVEYAHHNGRCVVDDLVCPAGMIKIPSELDKAPRCDCPKGFFKSRRGFCLPFTLCPPGEGVKTLPTPFRDTVCEKCPSGYHSPNSSFTEGCTLLPSVCELEANKHWKPTSIPHFSDPPTSATTIQLTTAGIVLISGVYFSPAQIYIMIAGAVCISFFLFMCCMGFKWIKKRRRKKGCVGMIRPNSHNDEVVRYQHESQPFDLEAGTSRREFDKMNQLKNDLCCSMRIDDVKMMFRFLTERIRDSEVILANLTTRFFPNQTREMICAIFDDLSNILGEKLTPQALHDCFVRRMNNRQLAEKVEDIFPEKFEGFEIV